MLNYTYTPGDEIIGLTEDGIQIETAEGICEMSLGDLFEAWMDYQLETLEEAKTPEEKKAKLLAKAEKLEKKAKKLDPEDYHNGAYENPTWKQARAWNKEQKAAKLRNKAKLCEDVSLTEAFDDWCEDVFVSALTEDAGYENLNEEVLMELFKWLTKKGRAEKALKKAKKAAQKAEKLAQKAEEKAAKAGMVITDTGDLKKND